MGKEEHQEGGREVQREGGGYCTDELLNFHHFRQGGSLEVKIPI